ncbi:MAG: Secretion system C-terminal sorting domain [Cytophagaceae bacterium]|jgi:hypothetical protein|nr:Secretion system C-terminal sorting domain [Cytophagaceae bacterium]
MNTLRKFFLFVLALLVWECQTLYAQVNPVNVNGVSVTVSSKQTNSINPSKFDLNTCEENFVQFDFNNTGSAAVENFVITTQPNADVLMLYSQLTDPNLLVDVANRSVTVAALPVGLSSLHIPIKASCENFKSTTHSSTSTLTFDYQNASVAQSQSIDFVITSGVLGYVASDDTHPGENISYTGHKGDVFTRRYNFQITEHAFHGILHMEEIIPAAPSAQLQIQSLELRINGQSKWIETTGLIDPLTNNLSRDIILDNVPLNATVEIFETVKIIGCPAGTGKLTFTYGCEASSCIPLRQMDLATNLGAEKPNLTVTDMNLYDFGTCLASSDNIVRRKFRVQNTGNARANNVYTSLRGGGSTIFPVNIVPLSSITITGSNAQVQSAIIHDPEYSSTLSDKRGFTSNASGSGVCFQDDLIIYEQGSIKVLALEPGEYIDIEWEERTCCVSNDKTNNYTLNAYGLMDTKCDNECGGYYAAPYWVSTDDHANMTAASMIELTGINNMFGCFTCTGGCGSNPAGTCDDLTLNNPSASTDYTETLKFKNNGFKLFTPNAYDFFPIDYKKFKLVIDFAVDGKLLLAPQSASNRGNISLKDGNGMIYHPVSQTALSKNEIFTLFGATDIPLNATDAGARAVFEFDPEVIFGIGANEFITTYQSHDLQIRMQSFINSLETSFEVSGVCSRPVNSEGLSNYFERIYLVPDGDDCPECKLAIGSYSDYIIVNCPGCVFPGVLVKGYEVERITIGEVDADNNGLRDAGGVTATGSPNLKMMTDNDIFKATTVTTLWSGTTKTYGSGANTGTLEQEPGFSSRFLTNFARLDLIGPYGNFIDVVVSTDHPIVVNYTQAGTSYHFVFSNNSDNIWTSNGTGHFLFQFPISLIRQKLQTAYGFNASQAAQFNYEADDQAEITAYYKVKPDFDLGSKYYESVDVATRCFYSDRFKDITIIDEADPASPYGISGSLKSTEVSSLRPYLNYVCEAYGSGFILADLKQTFSFYGAGPGNGSACVKGLASVQTISGNYESNDQLDVFPYEIRTFSRTEKMRFVLAKGYKLNKASSYLQSVMSFRENGSFDYTTYNELKSFDKLLASQIVSKGPAIEVYNGNSYVVGEIFEVDINYNSLLTYRDAAFVTQYPIPVGGTFSDYNEFIRQYMYLDFSPDCATNILDYFEYTDDPAYRAGANWVDYNKYFHIQGPKAIVKTYDSDKHIFSNTPITTASLVGRAWYSKPSADLWGGSSSPIVMLTKTVANVDIFKKVSKIPFKLTAVDQSANVFMYFTTKNGKVILGNLIRTNPDNSTQVFSKVQGVYQLGNLTYGQIFDFNLEVQFQCNEIKDDELYLHVGYTCDNSYPTFIDGVLDKVPCGIMNEAIRIIESNADMSVSYNSNEVTCSNISHEIKMTSLLDGGLYDFKPAVQLPATMTYKTGSAKLQVYEIVNNTPVLMKDQYGADILFTLTDPIISSSNLLSWDLTDLAGLDDLYIHGGGYALLTFDSAPACGITSDVVNASATATTYCNLSVSKGLLNPSTVTFATPCSAIVTLIGSDHICPESSGTLTAQLSGFAISDANYTWYKVVNGNRELLRGPDHTNTYTHYGLAETTTFEVVVSSENSACTISDSKTVSLYPLAPIEIQAPAEFCIGSAPVGIIGLPAGGYFDGPGVTLISSGVYTFSATAAGTYDIYYHYPDPVTGCTGSKKHTIIASACCKYALASTEVMCGEDAIRCITLKAVKPVDDGIKGMDFTLRYDRTLMRPTGIPGRGNATLGPVVLNGPMSNGMGSYAMTERTVSNSNLNELHVSIFYTGQAPATADFDGIGDVICIEFKILGTATAGLYGTTKYITIGDIYGGAFSQGVVDDEHKLFIIRSCVENNGEGIISITKNNFLKGKIMYHNDGNAPLRYDVSSTPSPYLITTIQPVTTDYGSPLCNPTSVNTTTTDINGLYTIDLTGGNGLKLDRDINGDYYNSCTSTEDVIDQNGNVYKPASPASILVSLNGYDAYLMESITTMRNPSDVVYVIDRKVPGVIVNTTANTLFPTPFQMIASDVNMDRKVRAVDITLVQQRAVSKLCEYPQVWNYNLGLDPAVYPANTTDQRSLDWRFVDKNQISTNLSYRKSTSYPFPAGTTGTAAGYYWRDNVPSPPRCLMGPGANTNACKSYANNFDIHAIMLGDIDGSWRANLNGAQQNLRTESEHKVVIKAGNKQQIGVNTYRIPVTFVSQDAATVSLDFALNYDEEQIGIQDVGNFEAANIASANVVYNDFENKELLFTSYTMTGFNSSSPIYYLDVLAKNGEFNANMLGSGDGYLNGQRVELVVEGSTITGIDDLVSGSQYGFELVPNPTSDQGEIVYNIKSGTQAKIAVYNTLGQVVTEYTNLEGQGNIQVGTSTWSSGMYQVILFTENSQKLIKKWVIQN